MIDYLLAFIIPPGLPYQIPLTLIINEETILDPVTFILLTF
jgi:hypothetical protein